MTFFVYANEWLHVNVERQLPGCRITFFAARCDGKTRDSRHNYPCTHVYIYIRTLCSLLHIRTNQLGPSSLPPMVFSC